MRYDAFGFALAGVRELHRAANVEDLPLRAATPQVPYRLLVTSDEFVIHSSWPGTTIGGEPGIVSGILAVTMGSSKDAQLNLAVGLSDAPTEECDHVEFVLSAEQTRALAEFLAARSQ